VSSLLHDLPCDDDDDDDDDDDVTVKGSEWNLQLVVLPTSLYHYLQFSTIFCVLRF
jgi:hypothetical protein